MARRIGNAAVTEAEVLLDDLDLVPLHRRVQDVACRLADPTQRTVDALHLASALLLGDALSALVTYDLRLAAAARREGLPVSVPEAALPDG